MGPSMELRDYFAGQAVVPLLAIYERPDFSYTVTKKETAHRAYEMADAMIEIRASKILALAATVPPVGAANSQSVAALSEIVWDWLTENAVDVMVDECDVNILIQRLNAGTPALHT